MQHTLTIRQSHIFFSVFRTIEKRAIGILLVVTIAMAVLYVYFLGNAVVFAVEQREIQSTIIDYKTNLSNLEMTYLKQKSALNADLASSMGLIAIGAKQFVQRDQYLGQANARNE